MKNQQAENERSVQENAQLPEQATDRAELEDGEAWDEDCGERGSFLGRILLRHVKKCRKLGTLAARSKMHRND